MVLSSEISCVKNRSNHSACAASQPRVSFPKLGAEIRNYCGKNGDGDDGDGDRGGDGDDGDGDDGELMVMEVVTAIIPRSLGE